MRELADELQGLPISTLLGAAYITYLPSAPEDVRQESLRQWCEGAGLASFDIRQFLSSESEQLVWKGEGLPSDVLSMENAIAILQVHER